MAELVAEAFLTVIFEKLFEKLTSQDFKNLFRGKKSIDGQLRELNLKLIAAKRLLNDAEERQLEDQDVRKWLDELKDVIYRAQDLVDEIDYEAQRSKHERESESNKSFLEKMKSKIVSSFSHEFEKTIQETAPDELANILEDLKLLLGNEVGRRLKVEEASGKGSTAGVSSKRQIAPLREGHVRGRDADREKIMDMLLSDDAWGGKIGVLPIVGMGGLGKTTLAQLVYDDPRWTEHGFELKAWVTVSTEFDTSRIMKSILQQVSPNSTCSNEEQILQRQLKEALKDKKFLIVLDDVWDENEENWDVLKCIFTSGACESRIIVTTRSRDVANIVETGKVYELSGVSLDDCWKIFVDHAFDGDLVANAHLEGTGRRIVEKCGGLPLAVRSLGGFLRTQKDPKKWETILRSHVWEWCKSQNNNSILPSLWLSYHHLPSYLKQCFAYCSVFPKAFEFQKEKIILLWMAEGFLQTDRKGKKMEEVGEEYFDNLISRSLFQRSSRAESKFVMHDLVHDLAMFVSGDFCLAVNNKDSLEFVASKTRHLSESIIDAKDAIREGPHIDDNDSIRESLSRASHLRSLIGQRLLSSSNELIEELLAGRRCLLRVLSLQSDLWFSRLPKLSSLPNSISKLKHLRYLNLSDSDIEDLPCSVCTLYNLQTLLLLNCKKMTKLPDDMGRLINLRHLDTTGSPLVKMPPQMGNLTELQTLTDFVLGEVHDNASCIKELGKLQHLGGKLRISGLQNVANVKGVQEVNLRCKEKLSELTFEWQGDTKDTKGDREVLDALQPHVNLKKLTICSYGGFNFPNWIGDSSFSKVVSIHLSHNKYCWSLPPIGQLPSLQELVIKGFHGLEKIGAEFYGNNPSATPFQSLEFLSFEDMTELDQWSFIACERDIGGAFPSLKRLSLENCPKLWPGSLLLADINDDLFKWEFRDQINLYWELATVDTKRDKQVLDAIQPRKNLMGLVINGVVGSSFPNWNLGLFCSNIVSIYLVESQDCVSLPPLGQLPFLRELLIEGFHELETIGDEFYGNNPSVTPFQSLELLRFKNMSKWKQWSFIGGEKEGGTFPSLNQLCINGCPNLLIGSLNLVDITLQLPRRPDLYWERATVDTKRDKQVLDAIQPRKNLMTLDIEGVVGSSFPNWILVLLLSNIVSICLFESQDCVFLPPLGQLPFLQELVIEGFHELETIVDEFYGNNPSVTPFQSLEVLRFKNMSKWKQWSFIGGEKEGGAFPSLKQLCINGCPNLLIGSLPNPDSLETLQISGKYKQFPLSPSDLRVDEQLFEMLEFLRSHRYVSVKEININSCDGIKSLRLDYFPSLEKLTLLNCCNLESLTLSEEGGTEELHSLSYLAIQECKSFRSMPQPMQRLLPSLAILDIWNCPEMEPYPKGGLPSSLEELRIYGCSKLVAQYRHWDLQRLTSLKTLEIKGCDEVFDSFPEGLLPVSLTHLSLRNIRKLNGSAFQHVTSLHELVLWDCKELQDLPEQVLCTSLRSLVISGCPILEQRYEPENGEDWHKIYYIPKLRIGGWSRGKPFSETEEW